MVACIPRSWLCNHINECGDNSDEDDDVCGMENSGGSLSIQTQFSLVWPTIIVIPGQSTNTSLCNPGEHECDNGVCVAEAVLCDGENNCGDFSDETKCSKYLRTRKSVSTAKACIIGIIVNVSFLWTALWIF